MKWSCQTSKEEIISLIKVFFFLPKSFSQSELKCQRKIDSIKRTLQDPLPDKCRRRGRGKGDKERNTEKEDKEKGGGGGGKGHSKSPPHNHCMESFSSLCLLPPHPSLPHPGILTADTDIRRGEPGPQRDLEGTVFSRLDFVGL